MNVKKVGRWLAVASLLWALPLAVRADEIVHFTNGAEMTVRSHVVDKEMVKLDLGGNSFITFPMAMVDKIVSAGQDVFLNPAFHPANQAVPGSSNAASAPRSTGSIIADTAIRGGGGSVGLVRQGGANTAGVMLGEAADQLNPNGGTGNGSQPVTPNRRAARFNTPERRGFDPGRPVPPGAPAVIMPPTEQAGAPKDTIRQISFRPEEITAPPKPPPPPQPSDPQDGGDQTPPEDPPQDPPENN